MTKPRKRKKSKRPMTTEQIARAVFPKQVIDALQDVVRKSLKVVKKA